MDSVMSALEISQNSQKNTCARFPFKKNLQNSMLELYYKKFWRMYILVAFAKFLKTTFL